MLRRSSTVERKAGNQAKIASLEKQMQLIESQLRVAQAMDKLEQSFTFTADDLSDYATKAGLSGKLYDVVLSFLLRYLSAGGRQEFLAQRHDDDLRTIILKKISKHFTSKMISAVLTSATDSMLEEFDADDKIMSNVIEAAISKTSRRETSPKKRASLRGTVEPGSDDTDDSDYDEKTGAETRTSPRKRGRPPKSYASSPAKKVRELFEDDEEVQVLHEGNLVNFKVQSGGSGAFVLSKRVAKQLHEEGKLKKIE